MSSLDYSEFHIEKRGETPVFFIGAKLRKKWLSSKHFGQKVESLWLIVDSQLIKLIVLAPAEQCKNLKIRKCKHEVDFELKLIFYIRLAGCLLQVGK